MLFRSGVLLVDVGDQGCSDRYSGAESDRGESGRWLPEGGDAGEYGGLVGGESEECVVVSVHARNMRRRDLRPGSAGTLRVDSERWATSAVLWRGGRATRERSYRLSSLLPSWSPSSSATSRPGRRRRSMALSCSLHSRSEASGVHRWRRGHRHRGL